MTNTNSESVSIMSEELFPSEAIFFMWVFSVCCCMSCVMPAAIEMMQWRRMESGLPLTSNIIDLDPRLRRSYDTIASALPTHDDIRQVCNLYFSIVNTAWAITGFFMPAFYECYHRCCQDEDRQTFSPV